MKGIIIIRRVKYTVNIGDQWYMIVKTADIMKNEYTATCIRLSEGQAKILIKDLMLEQTEIKAEDWQVTKVASHLVREVNNFQ